MIPGDLNQLPKKIKRASPSPPLRRSVPSGSRPSSSPTLRRLSLSLFLSLPSPFLSSPLPPHDNESLPCGRGIICGTGSKMPCEPHYRMHDYHDSGTAPVSTSFPSPRGRCRPRGIAETVNQRQGRVRGRGIGAARSSQPSRRARRGCLGKYKRCSLVSEFGAGGEFPSPSSPLLSPPAELVITSERCNGYAAAPIRVSRLRDDGWRSGSSWRAPTSLASRSRRFPEVGLESVSRR